MKNLDVPKLGTSCPRQQVDSCRLGLDIQQAVDGVPVDQNLERNVTDFVVNLSIFYENG